MNNEIKNYRTISDCILGNKIYEIRVSFDSLPRSINWNLHPVDDEESEIEIEYSRDKGRFIENRIFSEFFPFGIQKLIHDLSVFFSEEYSRTK